MKLKDVIICWKPSTKEIKLVRYSDKVGRSKTQLGWWTSAGCTLDRADPLETECLILAEAMPLVVAEGLDPAKVHECLMQIDEYLDACTSDMPGAHEERVREG